jgi:hypothetical protein
MSQVGRRRGQGPSHLRTSGAVAGDDVSDDGAPYNATEREGGHRRHREVAVAEILVEPFEVDFGRAAGAGVDENTLAYRGPVGAGGVQAAVLDVLARMHDGPSPRLADGNSALGYCETVEYGYLGR